LYSKLMLSIFGNLAIKKVASENCALIAAVFQEV